MPKRDLSSEHIRARELFVNDQLPLAEISTRLGIHITTLRRWRRTEKWAEARNEGGSHVHDITDGLMRITAHLLDDLEHQVEDKQAVDDKTVTRVEKLIRSATKIGHSYDNRRAVINAMQFFINYLRETNDIEAIKLLSTRIEHFYKWFGLLGQSANTHTE